MGTHYSADLLSACIQLQLLILETKVMLRDFVAFFFCFSLLLLYPRTTPKLNSVSTYVLCSTAGHVQGEPNRN